MPGSGGRIGADPGQKARACRNARWLLCRSLDLLSSTVFDLECDADHLAIRPAIHREDRFKHLFGRHQETRLFFDRTTDMVRQSAVCIRNIRSALDHENFSLFIQPAQTRAHDAPPATPPTIITFIFVLHSARHPRQLGPAPTRVGSVSPVKPPQWERDNPDHRPASWACQLPPDNVPGTRFDNRVVVRLLTPVHIVVDGSDDRH